MAKEKSKINPANAIGLVATAVIFDFVGLALNFFGTATGIGLILTIPLSLLWNLIGIIVFAVWYFLLGLGWTNPKRLAGMFGGGLIELIPILNALPGFTLAAIVTIATVKAEETLGVKLPGGK